MKRSFEAAGVQPSLNYWCTPPEIVKALGRFDLDPCASVPQPFPCATEQWTSQGLDLRWRGRVWLNPPYGKELGRWLAKLAEHGRGTALIFARVDTDAFFEHVWSRAHALLFLRRRLRFLLPDGTRLHNAPAASVLVAFGQEDATRLSLCGLDGAFITHWRTRGTRLPRSAWTLFEGAAP